jgi:hypothetical protein
MMVPNSLPWRFRNGIPEAAIIPAMACLPQHFQYPAIIFPQPGYSWENQAAAHRFLQGKQNARQPWGWPAFLAGAPAQPGIRLEPPEGPLSAPFHPSL